MLRTFSIQAGASTRKAIAAGVAQVTEMLAVANSAHREQAPASHLLLGLQCGGSAYGCAPSPSLKLATNTALWNRQEEDIDINCGEIVDGSTTVNAVGERFFQMILDTASGRKSKSELHGYGQSEFVPWQLGPVM